MSLIASKLISQNELLRTGPFKLASRREEDGPRRFRGPDRRLNAFNQLLSLYQSLACF
jgi:hypothetical protein